MIYWDVLSVSSGRQEKQQRQPPLMERAGSGGSGALLSLDSAKLIPLGFGQAEARAPCH